MAFNIDYSVCIIIMATLTAIYVIAGGYMATAINDFIQGIIMLFGIVAVIAAVIHSKGGFMSALQGLANVSDPAVSDTPGIFASFSDLTHSTFMRCNPYITWNMGTSSDGSEILCH